MNRSEVLYIGSMIIITMEICLLGWLYYLSFYPFQVVQFYEFKVQQEEVQAGSNIVVLIDFKKNYDYRGDINFYIVDGVSYLVPVNNLYRLPGETQVRKIIEIPESFSGTYHIEAHLEYQITPFRTINYVFKSNEFTVINSN